MLTRLIKIHHLATCIYLEIDPATSLNVFTLMGDAFGRRGKIKRMRFPDERRGKDGEAGAR